MNLRIAYVTDTHLIDKMKKKYAHLFFDVGMSSMVLVRYDGHIQKLDLATVDLKDTPDIYIKYNHFINAKSTKPVDEISEAVYQTTASARLPMLVMFMDFKNSDPEVVDRCTRLLQTMEEIASVYEHIFKVYWTQDPL